MKKIHILISFLLVGCASYKAQYNYKHAPKTVSHNKEILHSFYIIGDAGNANMGETLPSLQYFTKHLNKADKNSTALFLGDNVYPVGIYPEDHTNYELSKYRIQTQIDAVKNFKGQAIFTPGNHDWYNGLAGVKRQEKIVEKDLGKGSFLPENGCGLDKVNINDELTLIIIDSKWFITNWDKEPKINEDCDIKNRQQFFDELLSFFKKNRSKNIVVAVHHPLYSNGPHGGSYSFKDHLKPLPVLGTLKNMLRSHAGIETDNFNKNYSFFIDQVKSAAKDFKQNIVFVSGHEHNLQYIEKDGFKQVVSGSGSKQNPAIIGYGAHFTYGNHGFAKLNYYTDGSAIIEYYSANKKDGNQLLYSKEIVKPFPQPKEFDYSEYNQHLIEKTTSIYPKETTEVSGFYKFIWGDLHREKFGKDITVPVLELDKIHGGLLPVQVGGGNQTKSLRLENPEGKQYALRSMQKDAGRIMGGILRETFVVDLMQDIFTMSHPFAAFVIPGMASAVNIYHTNPKLYYMPKQPNLGKYNSEFGNNLYLLEERPAGDRSDVDSFGNSENIISTLDVLEKIRKNEKHSVDQEWAVRSRLFDMVIGDWDRHEDQWRFAAFKTDDGKTYYRPIPRDRDQPFSKFDGVMIPIFKQFAPIVRNMQSLDHDVKNMKWFNYYPRFFDTEFLNKLTLEDWLQQAEYIQQHLTDEVIENAIKQLPKNIYEIDGEEIIAKLKSRRNKLKNIAERYYNRITKVVQVVGTDKDDKFIIERLNNNETKVTIYRKKKGEDLKIYERTFLTKETKEIQLFGLNGDDEFHISGDVDNGILLRLIGGQNHDVYTDKSSVSGWSKKTKVYDFKSKKNTVKSSNETADLRSNSYYKNTYNHRDFQNNTTVVSPTLGSNPDDGFFFGANVKHTRFGFKKLPFASQHNFTANHYSSTLGYDFEYNGEFTEAIGAWSLHIRAKLTSDNYSFNFFGWGNESVYDKNFDINHYRVKREEKSIFPSLLKRLRGGSIVKLTSSFEAIEVEETPGRFINNFTNNPTDIFDTNYFVGGEMSFEHHRVDNMSFPTKGMNFNLAMGAKMNIDNSERHFGYLTSSLAIYQNLVQNRSLVFASEIGTHLNFKNRFEIYHAAAIGGDRNLRGFHQERFTGTESFYHSNDLRLRFGKFKALIPMKIGITGGYDYGRVWSPYSPDSKKWHTSYGGSIWLSGIDLFTANFSLFNSTDGNRFAFSVGFNF